MTLLCHCPACRVEVYTSDIRGAGTDAKVHIIMFGTSGMDTGEYKGLTRQRCRHGPPTRRPALAALREAGGSQGPFAHARVLGLSPWAAAGPITLDNSSNNFERGQHDIFFLESLDLGDIHEIEIGHDVSVWIQTHPVPWAALL